jgi:hypothetical protein
MSGKGNYWDNAGVQQVFSSLGYKLASDNVKLRLTQLVNLCPPPLRLLIFDDDSNGTLMSAYSVGASAPDKDTIVLMGPATWHCGTAHFLFSGIRIGPGSIVRSSSYQKSHHG